MLNKKFIFQQDQDPQDPVLPFHTKVRITTLRKKWGKEYNTEEPIWESEKWCIFSPSEGAQWHFHQGCNEPLKKWINASGDALFVLGFCVIAFLKLTFLGKWSLACVIPMGDRSNRILGLIIV